MCNKYSLERFAQDTVTQNSSSYKHLYKRDYFKNSLAFHRKLFRVRWMIQFCKYASQQILHGVANAKLEIKAELKSHEPVSFIFLCTQSLPCTGNHSCQNEHLVAGVLNTSVDYSMAGQGLGLLHRYCFWVGKSTRTQICIKQYRWLFCCEVSLVRSHNRLETFQCSSR